MSGASKRGGRAAVVAHSDEKASERGMALGFLAMLPMFVAYEMTLAPGPEQLHNTAERVLSLPLALFGSRASQVRWIVLGLLTACALVWLFQREFGLWRRVGRIVWLGLLSALLLGPVLVALHELLGVPEPSALYVGAPTSAPRFAQAMFHFGGAAYEEIVFRVGLQSIGFLLLSEVGSFYLGAAGSVRALADVGSIGLSALVFAAAHLAVFTQVLGPGGERFDLPTFAWRFLAGVLLGVLFRWRGAGVAAWSHGFFDVALLLGAGPRVFL